MPIANCIVNSECSEGAGDLVGMWAKEAGISSKDMTVNVIKSDQQFGNKYSVMVNLYLPTLWPGTSVSSIQISLAKALSKYFNMPINEIHIITLRVASKLVVEAGEEQEW